LIEDTEAMSSEIREQNKPDALTRELWRVAGAGDVDLLEQVLARGADVNASDRTGVTALMRAAYHGKLEMVRALVEHGADFTATDSDGLTALMVAKHAGHEEIVNALVSWGAEESPRRTVHKSLPVETPQEAVADTSKKVRTLHEPPEIWDLVHTTQPDSGYQSTPAGRPAWTRFLVLALSVIVIGGGAWLGFMALRGSGSATDATPVQGEVTVAPKSSPSSNRKAVRPAESVKKAELKKTEPLLSITTAADVKAVRTVDSKTPIAAQVALAAKKSAAKPRAQSVTKSEAAVSRSKKELSTQSPTPTDATAATKESKMPIQPASQPVKTNAAPKPKVIQWP
jgi:hypothetical protein